jgi:hypothetical protein
MLVGRRILATHIKRNKIVFVARTLVAVCFYSFLAVLLMMHTTYYRRTDHFHRRVFEQKQRTRVYNNNFRRLSDVIIFQHFLWQLLPQNPRLYHS